MVRFSYLLFVLVLVGCVGGVKLHLGIGYSDPDMSRSSFASSSSNEIGGDKWGGGGSGSHFSAFRGSSIDSVRSFNVGLEIPISREQVYFIYMNDPPAPSIFDSSDRPPWYHPKVTHADEPQTPEPPGQSEEKPDPPGLAKKPAPDSDALLSGNLKEGSIEIGGGGSWTDYAMIIGIVLAFAAAIWAWRRELVVRKKKS